MHHCAHMYGAATYMSANSNTYGYGGPPGWGFGPLEMMGLFLLAAIAFALLMWMTLPRQPAQEGTARAFLERPRERRRDFVPESSHEMWTSPPEIVQEASYEQPQADYPRMYYERPSKERYPETPE